LEPLAEFKVPISILGAETDQMSPPALLKQFEELLASKSEVRRQYLSLIYQVPFVMFSFDPSYWIVFQ
jgi:hypothetical protein